MYLSIILKLKMYILRLFVTFLISTMYTMQSMVIAVGSRMKRNMEKRMVSTTAYAI